MMRTTKTICLAALLSSVAVLKTLPATTEAQLENVAIDGKLADGKARIVIEAILRGAPAASEKLLFATALNHAIKVTQEKVTHSFNLKLEVLQGAPKELPFTIIGDGEIRTVTGDALLDWSVRQETNGMRTLILRPRASDLPMTQLAFAIGAEQIRRTDAGSVAPITLVPPQASLFNGYVRAESSLDLQLQAQNTTGLVPVDARFLPESFRPQGSPDAPEPLAFRFHGTAYSLPLAVSAADPEDKRVVLRDFNLIAHLNESVASFELRAVAQVKNPKGGSIKLLSGHAALTKFDVTAEGKLHFDQGDYVLEFERAGEFPIKLHFNATVQHTDEGKTLDFKLAPAALQPVILRGLAADTEFQFLGAPRPEREGDAFLSYLPPDGAVRLTWKEARSRTEGKLFYATEMLSQMSVSPGLMRQIAILDFKVMQGELNEAILLLRGNGEVTRVQGDHLLSWRVEAIPNSADRRLVAQFNQAQKDQFALQVHLQTPLGAFPQEADAVRIQPEGATRFSGYARVLNDGAVRLEIVGSTGLSQISPEQFPETAMTKALFPISGGQRFAYRFSGGEYVLRIRADQISPELTVSQLLAYHLAENELSIDAEIELDIREAPLRELLLQVPPGYAIARLTASGMRDYFVKADAESSTSELRLVYGQPLSGRQLVQLRLERNQALGNVVWDLPRIEISSAKSVRGHVGVSSDAGFRVLPERTESLTEIATAFFPRKIAGIQTAFRLTGAQWTARLRVERLPQSIQADVFHLFSVGEGVAYGSSLINYAVSGSPRSVFQIELSSEYFNVEFIGKDIRNWQQTNGGYTVQLHTPVAGAYTLLATYERPFKAQGETLGFTGARPIDAQSEQGHTVVTSAYEFQVSPVNVSSSLMALETGELPTEYRLFFDAPVLAAYRYTSRPFNLTLQLTLFAQGDSLNQIVDRAVLETRISKEGQVVTDARYFVKSRGSPSFRMKLPLGTELWSASVNGSPVVPVIDKATNVVPLPPQIDPNAVLTLDLKLATRSQMPDRPTVHAPVVAAPILLAEWHLEPDAGQRLFYQSGSVMPSSELADISGFAQVSRTFRGEHRERAMVLLIAALILVILALMVWRWSSSEGVYRSSARQIAGLILGLGSMGLAVMALLALVSLTDSAAGTLPKDVRLVMPVQQAGNALNVELLNVSDRASLRVFRYAWPAVLAVVVWCHGTIAGSPSRKSVARVAGWALLAWAALRWPNGAPGFFILIAGFLLLFLALPAFRKLARLPKKPASVPPSPQSGAAPAAASALVGALIGLGAIGVPHADAAEIPATNGASQSASRRKQPLAQSMIQTIRVEDAYARATARVRWNAAQGELLPILFEPAVLTRIEYPTHQVKLVESLFGSKHARQLLALGTGPVDIQFDYQVHIRKRDGDGGFVLPTRQALVNEITLTIINRDVDAFSSHMVSISRQTVGADTLAKLILSPVDEPWIGWKPRTRDLKSERPIFYAEITQLYAPSTGVVEGVHHVSIRTAQGELTELVFHVPAGATITDVSEFPDSTNATDQARNPPNSAVALWRFDPETRRLRVTFAAPQSRPFGLIVRSQAAAGPLPFEQSIGLISVENAAAQIGLMGVATGTEVQLDSVEAQDFSPINLEDFPGFLPQWLQGQIAGLTVRRAFRYADARAMAALKASPVEPDIRVEAQSTLSLGEDRIVLAVNLAVEISRAGIFRLSFALPDRLEVDAISGQALSHWTESASADGRVVTLHLRGKTEGNQAFAVTLTGAGLKIAQSWNVPKLEVRESAKQRGTLVIVPEQGMRLQVGARDGVTQLDPEKSGIRQKGVLVFRLLQMPWNIALDVEQVDPWVQVTSLQQVTVSEAQVKVSAQLQYQIENTGLKAFRVFLPENAQNVRFEGEQIADFLPVSGVTTNSLQLWEAKLHRRVIGRYLLTVTHQLFLAEQATNAVIRGVQASDVNLQRGFVTLQSAGRLQLRVEPIPSALQPIEWQSIPNQFNLAPASASYTFRLIEPRFDLPVDIERHEAVRLLPARVTDVTFQSVISDNAVMLTRARLTMAPGDKRLLNLTLPRGARFWFAFVDERGVWPWREKDRILIPLEQQSRTGAASTVEIFYTSEIGKAQSRSLDLKLVAPKFDLPLENVQWRVYLDEKWQLQVWSGTLQLQEEKIVRDIAASDVRVYLQNEATAQQEKTRRAEQMLNTANSWLENGDPQQARRAFEAAYSLSTHDNAFNEDARVQLHNLKVQQALVGLNVRQATAAGESDPVAVRLRESRGRPQPRYTQQEAKEIMGRKSADESSALRRLAERLVQQQDAAVASPAAIRASIPQQGRMIAFQRAVVVDAWADLHIVLEARMARSASWGVRTSILAGACVFLALVGWAGRSFR